MALGDAMMRAGIAERRLAKRTAQQQADDFVAANDRSPVIQGAALEPDPTKPAKGGRYQLADGTWHRLGVEACRILPKGYPRWRL